MSLKVLFRIKNKNILSRNVVASILNGHKKRYCKLTNNSEIVYKSPFPDVQLTEASLAEYVLDKCAKYGNDVALVDNETGMQIKYSKLLDLTVKSAKILANLGVKQGDIVTIFSPNSVEYPIVTLAILLNGAIVSPVNYLYSPVELGKTLNLSSSTHVFTISEICHVVEEALPLCPSVKKIILMNGDHSSHPVLSKLLEEIKECSYEMPSIPSSSIAIVPFSSGTTGLPKGVLLTQKNITSILLAKQQKDAIKYTREDIVLCVLPFFHAYGLVLTMLGGLVDGSKQIIMPKFNPIKFLDAFKTYKCTYLPAAPPMLQFMAKHPLTSDFIFHSVKNITTGAAPISMDVIHQVLQKLNKDVILRQGYGLTETSSLVAVNPPYFNKYHTVGYPTSNTMFKVMDIEAGISSPVGQTGEFYVKGPQIMKGYLNNETATREALTDDGWFKTGDLSRIDEDGHIIIVDRLKELIKVKGFQVAPAELEAVLLTHPSVFDAAVTGVPHDKYGEVPKAYVVKKPNSEISSNELINYVEKNVAPFKKIHQLSFIGEIPKSAGGKILRRLLKDEF